MGESNGRGESVSVTLHEELKSCRACPRRCGADRTSGRGLCGAGEKISLSGTMLHRWEEPCVSGSPEGGRGTGAVFFRGCPLGCVFCQNAAISRRVTEGGTDPAGLAEILLELQDRGAYSIDLVSPTQYAPQIIRALELAKEGLRIPVIWNTGGYERPETIRRLDGLADVYLTDMKFGSPETARRYAHAADYPETALAALREMVRQCGDRKWDDFPDGQCVDPMGGDLFAKRLRRGVIVRHLVIPGERRDSMRLLDATASAVGAERVILALMRQYTPEFAPAAEGMKNLRRRVTTFEYESVRDHAEKLGFRGYGQDASSASGAYTPDVARGLGANRAENGEKTEGSYCI